MAWVAVAIAASTVASAGAGIYGANKAAGAQRDAANQQAALSQQNMLFQTQLQEPQRYLGYQAMNDLASLYGYGMSPYQSVAQINAGSQGGAPINVDGRAGRGSYSGIGDVNPFSGARGGIYGGSINPMTGAVTVNTPGTSNRDAALSDAATSYLRTGQGALDGEDWSRFRSAIDNLRGSGWQYQDPAKATGMGGSAPGQAGNMSRFFASPDYQFRRDEGMRGLGNSFAARGGAFGGNALRALSEYNSNLASAEFGNYFNRLGTLAGYGTTATNNVANAANNNTTALMGAAGAVGDARASGVMGASNSVGNALNSGLNNYLLQQGGYFNRPAQAPAGASLPPIGQIPSMPRWPY